MKVLVTPRSFGKTDPGLFTRLENAGLDVIRNATGKTLDEAAMIGMLAPCEGLVVGIDPVNARVLEAAPRLKVISKYGVGLDNVDLGECEKRGIQVFRTLGANSNAVADYAFALMLAVARKLAPINEKCHKKDWGKITGIDVYGKTLGIIGLGSIGKCVARRARGFEMRVLGMDVNWDEEFALEMGVTRAGIDRICQESDFITLHCLLNDETRHIINAARLAQMKDSAILINTARGELVDEDALLDALLNHRIYGAGLDVFAHEPPEKEAWYELDNLVMGSHCSSSTRGATEMMGNLAVDNLLRGLGLPF